MDRQTVYAGQIPLETDILKTGQNMMVGLAKLAAAVLGATTIVDGFTVTPTTPASLNVLVTPGEIHQLENLEQSSWSSLGTDTHSILKQGLLMDAATLGITPPGTVGYSQNFLIEVQYQDVDSGSTVLPYFNASNPSVPFSGPGNAGTAQNTVRKGVAAIQVKAGIAAPTGTQTTPTPDAGWTGIYVVTVANGATTITSGNITQLLTAPWIISTLPNVPLGVQGGSWAYAVDTSATPNLVTATLYPIPSAYGSGGMNVRIKMANAPTGPTLVNYNGLGTKSLVKGGGVALSGGEWAAGDIVAMTFDGTVFQLGNVTTGSGQRPILTAPKTLYVNGTTGSDSSYDGTQATVSGAKGPFATIQKALNVMATYDNNGFDFTISVADYLTGYNGATLPRVTGSGRVLLTGNITTPSNVLVGGNGFGGTGTNGLYWVQGFRFVSSGDAIFGDLSGTLFYINNCEFGACTGPAHVVMQRGAVGVMAGTAQGVASPTCKISGSCPSHLLALDGGNIAVYPQALTITGTPAFSSGFWWAGRTGVISSPTGPAPYSSITGTATGPRYAVLSNAVIDTAGAGASYLPGNSAGATSTGGQYL